ncbi:MAG: redox-sensing transcriptional repressor Rex [Verrucomicrobiales bacterium]|nr:redox-sensing transcriptional repressor Rex [Verrucomicrobiales bacterium]
MEKVEIPKKTVYRLSIYSRCLEKLAENQVETVSSVALAKAAGVKPPQLRKDLGYVGQFGTRGLGYSVGPLSKAIAGILGSARLQPVVIIGVGNLGSALMRYSGFKKEGFEIIAAFDRFPEQVEERTPTINIPVHDVEDLGEYITAHEVKMAILAVPGEAAQQVANVLVEAGVQAILNFSPLVLQVPEEVIVNHVDLAVELESLSYFIN